MPTAYKKQFTKETEEELMNMTREEACLELTERQRLFCEYYIANHNAVLACKKAGYTPQTAHSLGYRLRLNENVNRYIAWLKLQVGTVCHVSAMDIVDHYARIAFADVTDFVKIEKGKITLIDGAQVDGQLIKSVKQGKDGVTIELVDKLAAMQKLERYFDIMPADYKQKLEERKVELLEKRLELERLKIEGGGETEGDDGFLEALKESATEVWGDDDE